MHSFFATELQGSEKVIQYSKESGEEPEPQRMQACGARGRAGVHASARSCVCVSASGCTEAFWKSLRGRDPLSGANRRCLIPWEGFPCSQALAWGVPLAWLPRYHDPPNPKP